MTSVKTEATPVKAVLFDMDGTLIDTENHYRGAVRHWLTESGLPWNERVANEVKGLASPLLADLLVSLGVTGTGRRDLTELIDGRVESDVRKTGVPWKPGARELVNSVVTSRLACGLVTMSCRSIVDLVLAEIDSPGFDVVITGECVAAAKPAPDAYLLAARMLATDPSSCVAVEDSLPGIASARSAGMRVIGAHLEPSVSGDLVDELWPSLLGRTHVNFSARRS